MAKRILVILWIQKIYLIFSWLKNPEGFLKKEQEIKQQIESSQQENKRKKINKKL